MNISGTSEWYFWTFSEHHINIQTSAIEIYKNIHGLLPAILGDVFKINRTLRYNLRIQNDFSIRVPKTVRYRTETISFLASKVWALVPEKIKECFYLEAFKSKIRKWKPDCPCLLWKTYLQHVGVLSVCTYLYFNTNAHSLSIYVTIIVIISRCQDILFIRMIQFRWRCNICIKP